MKKNILSLSIAHMIGGLGQAPSHGTAHVLQIPYYVLPPRSDAVAVQFRGNTGRDDVFDFLTFLERPT